MRSSVNNQTGRAPADGGGGRRWAWWHDARVPLLIALTGLLCYANTLRVPFYLDDFSSIVDNPALRHPGDLAPVWLQTHSRFVGYASFALNYWAGGTDVVGYHLVNLLIHLGAALAVYWLALLLFRSPALRGNALAEKSKFIALFAALIFSAHPLQTQAVTYIVQRLASLCALWYLLAVCCYLSTRYAQMAGRRRRVIVGWLAGTVISGLLALFTKQTAFTLPLALALCELVLMRGNGRIEWKYPIILISATALGATVAAAVLHLPTRETADISRASYLFTQFRVILTYLRLSVIPVGQNLDYDYPIFTSLWQGPVLLGLAVIACLAAFGLWCVKRHPPVSFGIGWMLVTIAVESSIIPIRDVIFEHRMYLPMAGIAIMAAYGIFWLLRKQRWQLLAIAAAAVVMCLGLSTYPRNEVWRDPLRLWGDTVAKSPRKGRPYAGRGQAYYQRGLPELALADYRRAIDLDSTDAFTWYNLGVLYDGRRDPSAALYCYTQAIRYKGDYARAYNNRGSVLLGLREYDAALRDLDTAHRIAPYLGIPYYNKAKRAYFLKDNAGALAMIDSAIALEPGYPWSHFWRGVIQRGLGRDAVPDFSRAIALDPGNGEFYYGRAMALARSDSLQRRADLRTSITLGFKPDSGGTGRGPSDGR